MIAINQCHKLSFSAAKNAAVLVKKDLSEEKPDIEFLIGEKDGSEAADSPDGLDDGDTITSRADDSAVVGDGAAKKR